MKRRVSVGNFVRLLMIDAIVLLVLRLIMVLSGCQSQPAKQAMQESTSVQLPVLMYHSVRRGEQAEYAVTPDTLEEDFRYIMRLGWHTVSPDQLIDYVFHGVSLPEKPVLLTFDDGFYNNLAYALPLLEQFDMCAVVNVVGEFSRDFAERDAHQSAYSYLTAEDIRQLSASGRVYIGNHTDRLHHISARNGCRILPGESEEQYHAFLHEDIQSVQSFLLNETGVEPVVFAYPYGFECPESYPVLHELGFLITLTCRERINTLTNDANCLYGLGRYNRSGLLTTEDFFYRILRDLDADT